MVEDWTVPGFRVEQLLATDGAAELWLAADAGTAEPVALRRLAASASAADVAALHREADLLCAVDSPYVLRLRTVVGQGAAAVLVLDHPAGGTLARLLGRRGRLDPGEVVTVAVPLALALAAAHARGIVHGNLSPLVVQFTPEGMPLLSGFGGGPKCDPAEPLGHLDPRRAAGHAADAAGDVWALGALCHHLLCGVPPYDGPTGIEVLAAPDRPSLGRLAPQTPPALVQVVEAALAADPAGRPSAGDLAIRLQQAEPAAAVRLVLVPSVAELGGPSLDRPAAAALQRPEGAAAGEPYPAALAAAALPPARHASRRDPAPPLGAGRSDDPDRTSAGRLRVSRAAVLAGAGALLLGGALLWTMHQGRHQPGPVASSGRPAAGAPSRARPDPGGPPAPEPGSAVPTPEPKVVVSIDPQGPPAAVPSTPAAPDWRQVLRELDSSRERSFATGDQHLLAAVYVAGSAAMGSDTAALAALASQGRAATGVRHQVRSVEQLSATADRAELRVVDVLAPQRIVAAGGDVVTERPGRGETSYDVTLLRQGGGWRIEQLGGG